MSDSYIPSFLMSGVSDLLRALTKNEGIARFIERIAHSLIFRKKRAIRSENRWANSQLWILYK